VPAADEAAGALLTVGRVGRAHGLDGSFHVTQPRMRLLEGRRSVIVNGEDVAIVRHAGTPARPILRLRDVDTREQVEALRGSDLWVPRAEAPPLEEDEFYAADLVGCRVSDGPAAVGEVRALVALPSCEALEVDRGAGARPLLVPLVRDAVRSVDVARGRIDVDLAFLGEEA
jgi:16S rRNA processing protein RimM